MCGRARMPVRGMGQPQDIHIHGQRCACQRHGPAARHGCPRAAPCLAQRQPTQARRGPYLQCVSAPALQSRFLHGRTPQSSDRKQSVMAVMASEAYERSVHVVCSTGRILRPLTVAAGIGPYELATCPCPPELATTGAAWRPAPWSESDQVCHGRCRKNSRWPGPDPIGHCSLLTAGAGGSRQYPWPR